VRFKFTYKKASVESVSAFATPINCCLIVDFKYLPYVALAFAAVFLFIVKYELILYKPHKFKYIKINI